MAIRTILVKERGPRNRKVRASAFELDLPPRFFSARVSAAEFEIPSLAPTQQRGRLSAFEFETPSLLSTLFESSWAYATGTSEDALLDGPSGNRKWTYQSGSGLLTVHASGGGSPYGTHPKGLNALGVDNTDGYSHGIHMQDGWEASRPPTQVPQDYAFRWWFHYRVGPGGKAHEFQCHPFSYQGGWHFTCLGSAGQTGNILRIICNTLGEVNVGHPDTEGYNRSGWVVNPGAGLLATGTWYRLECLIKFKDIDEFRVYPRIYSVTNLSTGAGTLIHDWPDAVDWEGAGYYLGGTGAKHWYTTENEYLHYDDDYNPAESGNTAMNDLWVGNNGSTARYVEDDAYAICGIKVVDGTNLGDTDSPWVGVG